LELRPTQRKHVQSFLERKPLFNIPHCASDHQHGSFTDQRRLLFIAFQNCAASRKSPRARLIERKRMHTRDSNLNNIVSKVPQVTLAFWIIKILATTLGETGGDAVTMSWLGETTSKAMGSGYLIGTGIFGVIFIIAVLVQIRAKKFHPFLYWLTIVATTTVGTTLADYCTRSLGIGYTGGSTILLICVIASLLIWRWSTGSVSIETVSTPKVEIFYWVTIMFSQTLGTALGDWVADTNEMGYLGAAAVFGGLLLLTALLYYLTSFSRAILFWAAFI